MMESKRLDVYGRVDLWEEPMRLRPYRRTLEPLPAAVARSRHALRVLAWLHSYHQAHAWQLQEACGISPFTLSRVMHPLYMAGLVARGRYNPFGAGAVPYTYKLYDGAPLRAFLRQLPSEQWLGVTGGVKTVFSSTHFRHNLMIGEIALAAASSLNEIGLVLGEQFAGASKMFPDCQSGAIGDMVLVTTQGMRIIIELSSSLSDRIPPKILRWARLLSHGDLESHGTVVVMLNGASRKKHRQVGGVIKRQMLQALQSDSMAQGGKWPSDREVRRARSFVVYADWDEWFQGVDPTLGFSSLACHYTPDGQHWEQTSLLDWDFQPPDPDNWQIPIRNLHRIYSVPDRLLQRSALVRSS